MPDNPYLGGFSPGQLEGGTALDRRLGTLLAIRSAQQSGPLKTYRFSAPGRWSEFDPSSRPVHDYVVRGYDSRMLHLYDASRDLSVQFLFGSGAIVSSAAGQPWQQIGDIRGVDRATVARAPTPPAPPADFGTIDMQTARMVRYNLGSFVNTGGDQWQQRDSGGQVVARLRELDRSRTAIVLFDETRNLLFRMNGQSRKISYGANGNKLQIGYKIMEVQP